MRTKWFFVLTAILALGLVTACAQAPAPAGEVVKETVVVEKQVMVTPTAEAAPTEPQYGGTLNLSLGADFVNFDPFYDVQNLEFKAPIYEAPIRLSDEGGFEPWLAEEWEVLDDGKTIRLHLREGVMFHNGREMTAEDVAWSAERAMDQEIGHHLGDRFTTGAGATVVDDYTVDIEYTEITHSALDGIARLYIYPQEAVDTIETVPVGTGPFEFAEWVPGDHLTLTAFGDYWQEGLPYLDEVVVKPIPDPQARMVNLLAGSIDALWFVPLADKALLEEAEDVTVDMSPPGFHFYAFLMNINEEPFDSQLVRQALNFAVDREKINLLAFSGEGNMTVIPVAESSWIYDEDLADYYTFDLDKAQELLAEAGYPDGFETSILIRGASGLYLDMAQVYQQDLAKIGVDIEILPTELPQYWPKLIGSEFTIVSHGTGDATVDPQGLFEGAACCRPFRNFFGITDNDTWFPEYKGLADQAARSQDRAERKELYGQALRIMVEQGWTIPIAWRQQIYAIKDHVHGLRSDMDGQIWLHEVWLSQ
ncbi:MAG: Heme-binding protein A [Anaerolineales bacterium]|nr:Heme-binding protein A [Anaerolineales bacterium]